MTQWAEGELNPVQREIVETGDGPVLILAGAGSGKTRVLTFRILYLLQVRRVAPYRILSLTFTNKAAREMVERITRLLGTENPNIWIGTFHSNCARILRREYKKLSDHDQFVIYDEDDQLRLLKAIMENFNYPTSNFPPRSILSKISHAKAYLKQPADIEYDGNDPYMKMVVHLYEEYNRALVRNNALDFDDLINKVIEVFKKDPATLQKYQRQFRYILVDEFQDTNVAQYRLIQLLAQEHGNLFVVGDDDQSIYRWRGAEVGNILRFESDFPGTKVFFLDQNYRSTNTILSAAQSVVRHNVKRKEKSLWTKREAGEKIKLTALNTSAEEARWITNVIRESVYQNHGNLSNFAILYRTNAQSRTLEEELRDRGIPYFIVGGVRFYERKEVKDVLAYIHLIINPFDEISVRRVVNFPARSIGKVTLERVENYAVEHSLSLFHALRESENISDISPKTKQRLLEFVGIIEKYRELRKKLTAGELVRSLVDELGLSKFYKSEGSRESLDRWENVTELLTAVSEFTKNNPDTNLEDYLSHVSLVTDIDSLNGKKESVTLMTLHNAKGLEFPTVFITGLEDGLFPVYGALDSTESLEEERRLFYVGATRAKDILYLTWAHQRPRYGIMEYCKPSRFLDELDESCVQKIEPSLAHTHERISVSPVKPKKEKLETQTASYNVGQEVRHPSFGYGTIQHVEGYGENTRLTVYFEQVGEKRLHLKFARLEAV